MKCFHCIVTYIVDYSKNVFLFRIIFVLSILFPLDSVVQMKSMETNSILLTKVLLCFFIRSQI